MKIILPDGSVEEAKDELRAIRHTASGSKETVSRDQAGNRTGY